VDEPLEDLINGNFTPPGGGVATYQSAVTDASGKAVLTNLPVGATDMFFIYVKPADSDTEHLPGGSTCRTAVSGTSLNNKETAIKVSTTPSPAAKYVGSSICLLCHTSYATEKQTLHKLGIMVPKSPSGLQDVSKFQGATDDTNFYAGLNKFEAGTTVYFYNTSGPTTGSFRALQTNPTAAQLGASGKVYFTLGLAKVGADYQVTFNNITNPADPNSGMVHKVALTYGGGEHKQRYLAKIGNSIYVIPLQYNPQGSDASADPARTTWLEYNTVSNGWWDTASNSFTLPTAAKKYKSFDAFCAGCHFTGYSVTENASGEFLSSAVADSNGEVHPVAGTKMEMNIGCESCHGAGSEHVQAIGNGKAIVTPLNITPEREVAICTSCHTRGESLGTAATHPVEALLDSNMKQMKPGTSRADFLANNTSRNDASAADGMWADGKHSSKHHQQATDFIQTKKYRNGSNLMSCASASCHDVHAPGTDRHQLNGASDNSLCLSCHTTIVLTTHMTTKAGYDMGPNATCIQCHATKTAKSGSGSPIPGMIGVSGTAYYQGDITSHRLDVPNKSAISPTNKMPIPYTNGCGGCHIPSGL
jgi:hypothetical protein